MGADGEGLNEIQGMTGLNFYALLAISMIEAIGAIFFALYRYTKYSHAGDTSFATSKSIKTLIMVGMYMWVITILWVPVDILLSQHG